MLDNKIINLIRKNLSSNTSFLFKLETKIFSWKELEFLFNFRPFLTSKRVHVLQDDSELRWSHQAWVTDQSTMPPSIIGNKLRTNALYFQDASRVNKSINSICKQIENEFESNCDAHIFFNLSDSLEGGFGVHHDSSHNVIIQIEGSSELKVWKNIAQKDSKKPTTKPHINAILNPGDAVFIPMKIWHSIVSKTQRLSISFPFNKDDNIQRQDRAWITLVK